MADTAAELFRRAALLQRMLDHLRGGRSDGRLFVDVREELNRTERAAIDALPDEVPLNAVIDQTEKG